MSAISKKNQHVSIIPKLNHYFCALLASTALSTQSSHATQALTFTQSTTVPSLVGDGNIVMDCPDFIIQNESNSFTGSYEQKNGQVTLGNNKSLNASDIILDPDSKLKILIDMLAINDLSNRIIFKGIQSSPEINNDGHTLFLTGEMLDKDPENNDLPGRAFPIFKGTGTTVLKSSSQRKIHGMISVNEGILDVQDEIASTAENIILIHDTILRQSTENSISSDTQIDLNEGSTFDINTASDIVAKLSIAGNSTIQLSQTDAILKGRVFSNKDLTIAGKNGGEKLTIDIANYDEVTSGYNANGNIIVNNAFLDIKSPIMESTNENRSISVFGESIKAGLIFSTPVPLTNKKASIAMHGNHLKLNHSDINLENPITSSNNFQIYVLKDAVISNKSSINATQYQIVLDNPGDTPTTLTLDAPITAEYVDLHGKLSLKIKPNSAFNISSGLFLYDGTKLIHDAENKSWDMPLKVAINSNVEFILNYDLTTTNIFNSENCNTQSILTVSTPTLPIKIWNINNSSFPYKCKFSILDNVKVIVSHETNISANEVTLQGSTWNYTNSDSMTNLNIENPKFAKFTLKNGSTLEAFVDNIKNNIEADGDNTIIGINQDTNLTSSITTPNNKPVTFKDLSQDINLKTITVAKAQLYNGKTELDHVLLNIQEVMQTAEIGITNGSSIMISNSENLPNVSKFEVGDNSSVILNAETISQDIKTESDSSQVEILKNVSYTGHFEGTNQLNLVNNSQELKELTCVNDQHSTGKIKVTGLLKVDFKGTLEATEIEADGDTEFVFSNMNPMPQDSNLYLGAPVKITLNADTLNLPANIRGNGTLNINAKENGTITGNIEAKDSATITFGNDVDKKTITVNGTITSQNTVVYGGLIVKNTVRSNLDIESDSKLSVDGIDVLPAKESSVTLRNNATLETLSESKITCPINAGSKDDVSYMIFKKDTILAADITGSNSLNVSLEADAKGTLSHETSFSGNLSISGTGGFDISSPLHASELKVTSSNVLVTLRDQSLSADVKVISTSNGAQLKSYITDLNTNIAGKGTLNLALENTGSLNNPITLEAKDSDLPILNLSTSSESPVTITANSVLTMNELKVGDNINLKIASEENSIKTSIAADGENSRIYMLNNNTFSPQVIDSVSVLPEIKLNKGGLLVSQTSEIKNNISSNGCDLIIESCDASTILSGKLNPAYMQKLHLKSSDINEAYGFSITNDQNTVYSTYVDEKVTLEINANMQSSNIWLQKNSTLKLDSLANLGIKSSRDIYSIGYGTANIVANIDEINPVLYVEEGNISITSNKDVIINTVTGSADLTLAKGNGDTRPHFTLTAGHNGHTNVDSDVNVTIEENSTVNKLYLKTGANNFIIAKNGSVTLTDYVNLIG